MPHMTAAFLLT
jgi:hypothetical protein